MPVDLVYVYVVYLDGLPYVTNSFFDLAVAASWVSQFDDEPDCVVRGRPIPLPAFLAAA